MDMCEDHNKSCRMVCKSCDDEEVCLKCISTTHRGHLIVPPKANSKLPIGNMCPKHGRPLIHVCDTCNHDLLCWNCFYPKHVTHKITDFQHFVKRTNDSIQNSVEQSQLRGKIDLATAQIKQRRDELKAQIDFMGDKYIEKLVTAAKRDPYKKKFNFSSKKTDGNHIAGLFGYLTY